MKDHILDSLHIADHAGASSASAPLRKIVLVGHGILHDIKQLELLCGIVVEDLPMIAGIICTPRMARDVFGDRRYPSLQKLLDMVKIPWTAGSFHCAANDAHYALRAALAMAKTQHEMQADMSLGGAGLWDPLDKLIKQPTPQPVRIRDEDIWQCGDFDELGEDLFGEMV